MKYIVSTMSMPVAYCFYEHHERNTGASAANPVVGDVPLLRKKVYIRGGAGQPSLKSGFGDMTKDTEGHPLWVADGIVTKIEDADYEALLKHPLFKKHLEKGLVRCLNHDVSENYRAVRKEVALMSGDPFPLLTPERFKEKFKNQAKMRIKTGAFEEDVDSHRN